MAARQGPPGARSVAPLDHSEALQLAARAAAAQPGAGAGGGVSEGGAEAAGPPARAGRARKPATGTAPGAARKVQGPGTRLTAALTELLWEAFITDDDALASLTAVQAAEQLGRRLRARFPCAINLSDKKRVMAAAARVRTAQRLKKPGGDAARARARVSTAQGAPGGSAGSSRSCRGRLGFSGCRGSSSSVFSRLLALGAAPVALVHHGANPRVHSSARQRASVRPLRASAHARASRTIAC
jgi:hypothetical protein